MSGSKKGARAKLREKRKVRRVNAKKGREALRKTVRGAAAVAALCLLAAGCNSATPSSKSARSEANRNVTTVNNNFGLLAWATNGAPVVVGLAGPVTVNVSDVNGTIAQSADTEGGDKTDLVASPALNAGVTGDAPVKAIADAVSAFASPTDALGAALSAMVEKYGWSSTTNALGSAAASCAGGSCGDK